MANDDHDFLSALVEGIREGFRGPPRKKGEKTRRSFGATLLNAVVIIFALGLGLGLVGAFIGFEATTRGWAAWGQEYGSGVVPGFKFGAGLGILVGLVYAVRAWWRGGEL